MVDIRATDHHDLDVERYRLGFYAYRRNGAKLFSWFFDTDFLIFKGFFERVVSKQIGQHIARFHHKIAAVGAMQRARLDHGKIGGQRAKHGFVLDASDQVEIGAVWFEHDRSALLFCVVYQYVDRVSVKRAFTGWRGKKGILRFFLIGIGAKILDIADDVFVNIVEILDDAGKNVVFFPEFVDMRSDGVTGDTGVKVLEPLFDLFAGADDATDDFVESYFHPLPIFFDLLTLCCGQGVVVFGGHGLTVVQQRDDQNALWRSLKPKALSAGFLRQPGKFVGFLTAEFFYDSSFLAFVVFVVECVGRFGA